ncbi:MAG: glycosyltransferase family 2 protein [Elusimicrobia bacterium]|nr:glycosyltransferase family 2 protein [Elusimicrobiota bacterium]
MKNKNIGIRRTLEIIPGALSWGVILMLVLLSAWKPVFCAALIITFDFYWIIRTLYLTTLLIMAHHKLYRQRNRDWLADCRSSGAGREWERIYHLVVFPVYKEGPDILRPSLASLRDCLYPKEKMIVIVSFESRHPSSRETAALLEKEFKGCFFGYISTFHPDNLPGEAKTKGANATWAARRGKEFVSSRDIPYDDVVISCFDADTCVDPGYFGCLTYHFITNPRPHQASYQPIPVYNNNIWHAPSFARLVEISASFCQMIESMRIEKFVTFSSHSMSFKTLIKIDYWPLNMVSDDSVVYWKAFLFYNGHYRVVPLYITVSMDAAYGASLWKTVRVQYRQKRRWAWGVENFPFLVTGFMKSRFISLPQKIRKSFQLLESHVTWAVWAIIITLLAPLPILLGGSFFTQMPISYNLPRIAGILLNCTLVSSLVWVLLSRILLPPRPAGVKWSKNILMIVEWVLAPLIILILGSVPALDAQTRLLLGKYMEFYSTEKKRPRSA